MFQQHSRVTEQRPGCGPEDRDAGSGLEHHVSVMLHSRGGSLLHALALNTSFFHGKSAPKSRKDKGNLLESLLHVKHAITSNNIEPYSPRAIRQSVSHSATFRFHDMVFLGLLTCLSPCTKQNTSHAQGFRSRACASLH